MGIRKLIIRESVADSIADVAWFIESKGMVKTAEKFANEVYDFLDKLAIATRTYSSCRDPDRNAYPTKENIQLYLLNQIRNY